MSAVVEQRNLREAGEDLLTALMLAVEMRAAQVRYFKDRSADNLMVSKRLEHEFDRVAKAAIGKARGDLVQEGFGQ